MEPETAAEDTDEELAVEDEPTPAASPAEALEAPTTALLDAPRLQATRAPPLTLDTLDVEALAGVGAALLLVLQLAS